MSPLDNYAFAVRLLRPDGRIREFGPWEANPPFLSPYFLQQNFWVGSFDVQPLRYTFRQQGVGVGIQEQTAPSEGLTHSLAPNPASDEATLRYTLDQPALVSFTLFDALGQEVLRLPAEQRGAGVCSIPFSVATLPAGVYLCRVTAGGQTFTQRIVVAR
jgi:hypothetical protein